MPEDESRDDDPTSLLHKLHGWAETSGRALELRVARTFREQRATLVDPSFAFVDPVTEVQREGDVLAEFSWSEGKNPPLPCSLVAIAECKASVGKPWIGFLPDRRPRLDLRSFDDWMVAGWAPYTPVNERLPLAWIGNPPFDDGSPATHIVAANLGRDRSKDGENNEAGNAVRQVLAAAEAHRQRTHVNQPGKERGTFIVAAIVTAAPLFTCTLSAEGAIEFVETERFSVWGHIGDKRRRVYIMQEARVAEFAEELRKQVLRASGDWPD